MKAKRVVKNKGLRALRARAVNVGRLVDGLTRLGDHLEAAGDPQWFVAAQAAASLERLRMARAALPAARAL